MKTWERQITDLVFQSLIAMFFIGLLMLTGCNSPKSTAFATVVGRVSLDGKPVQNARVVSFRPVRPITGGRSLFRTVRQIRKDDSSFRPKQVNREFSKAGQRSG